jgi:outer membrane protein assembly factor BamB
MDTARVYIPLTSKQVVALDRESGETVWTSDVEGVQPPIIRDGMLYVAGTDTVQALDPASGKSRWQAPLGSPPATGLVARGGVLLVLLETPEIVAIQTSNGMVKWRVPLEPQDGSYSFTADDMALYVAMPAGRVTARALSDGQSLWEQTLSGTLSPPATARDRVFVGSSDNFLYALKPASGAIEWKMRAGGDVIGAVANEDLVFFASLDNGVRALHRGNGNQQWRKSAPTRPLLPPVVTAGDVIVVGISPTLSSFDARTGTRGDTFTFPVKVSLAGEPLVDYALRPFHIGAVIITRDGQVVALRPNSTMYREAAPLPVVTLPGRPLTREQLP